MAKPRYLCVKDFEKTQHYSQRNPPWIKLHKTLFGDRDFIQLPVSARYLYFGLLTLASECDNKIVNDPSWIAQRLSIDASSIDLTPLYKRGFLLASGASIRRYHQSEGSSEERQRKSREDARELAPTVPVSAPTPRILSTPPLSDEERLKELKMSKDLAGIFASIGQRMP